MGQVLAYVCVYLWITAWVWVLAWACLPESRTARRVLFWPWYVAQWVLVEVIAAVCYTTERDP